MVDRESNLEWEEHQHEAVSHDHEHFHITHDHNTMTGGFEHLASSHGHRHDHSALSHSHVRHRDWEHEHAGEAHVHDHGDLQGSGVELSGRQGLVVSVGRPKKQVRGKVEECGLRARDWLDRFRPAGSPGAARPVGVPADEAATRTAELVPVFAALAATQRECESIRKAARAEADDRREHAALRAAAVLTSGEATADAQRAEARSRRLRHYEEDAGSIVAAAEQEARQVAERAERRIPELLDQVRVTLLQAVAGVAGVDPSDPASPGSVPPRNGFRRRSGKEP